MADVKNEIAYLQLLIPQLKHSQAEEQFLHKIEKEIEKYQYLLKCKDEILANLETIIDEWYDSTERVPSKIVRNAAYEKEVLLLKLDDLRLSYRDILNILHQSEDPLMNKITDYQVQKVLKKHNITTVGRCFFPNVTWIQELHNNNKEILPLPNIEDANVECVLPLGFIHPTINNDVRSRLDIVVLSNRIDDGYKSLSVVLVSDPCLWKPRKYSLNGVSPELDDIQTPVEYHTSLPVPFIGKDILFKGQPWTPVCLEYKKSLRVIENLNLKFQDPKNPLHLSKIKETLLTNPEILFSLQHRKGNSVRVLKSSDRIYPSLKDLLLDGDIKKSERTRPMPEEWLQVWNDYRVKVQTIKGNGGLTQNLLENAIDHESFPDERVSDHLGALEYTKRWYSPESGDRENAYIARSDYFRNKITEYEEIGLSKKVVPLLTGIPVPNDLQDSLSLELAKHFSFHEVIPTLIEYYDQIREHRFNDSQPTKAHRSFCFIPPENQNHTHFGRLRYRIINEDDVMQFFALGCFIFWENGEALFDISMFMPELLTDRSIEKQMIVLADSNIPNFIKDKCEPYRPDDGYIYDYVHPNIFFDALIHLTNGLVF